MVSPQATWVIGNFKQNLLQVQAVACVRDVAAGVAALYASAPISDTSEFRVAVAPTYVSLTAANSHRGSLHLFAQDVAAEELGAFTGEVGPRMLQEVGVSGAILGHSERRGLLGESDELVARKVLCALKAGLDVVLCVGETADERKAGHHLAVVTRQLDAVLAILARESDATSLLPRLNVAYEPVWAIGTGQVATQPIIAAMHEHIRKGLQARFGQLGHNRSILYGGSVKPDNANDLAELENVNGALVGGASLKPQEFLAIVTAFWQAKQR